MRRFLGGLHGFDLRADSIRRCYSCNLHQSPGNRGIVWLDSPLGEAKNSIAASIDTRVGARVQYSVIEIGPPGAGRHSNRPIGRRIVGRSGNCRAVACRVVVKRGGPILPAHVIDKKQDHVRSADGDMLRPRAARRNNGRPRRGGCSQKGTTVMTHDTSRSR